MAKPMFQPERTDFVVQKALEFRGHHYSVGDSFTASIPTLRRKYEDGEICYREDLKTTSRRSSRRSAPVPPDNEQTDTIIPQPVQSDY